MLKIRIAILYVVSFFSFSIILSGCKTNAGLKQSFKNDFHIGVAMNSAQIQGLDKKAQMLIQNNFNSIVAENCMKSEKIQPTEGNFQFAEPDKLVEFGMQNNMHIIGHTLIWHSQAPKWFFVDNNGQTVSREVLIERMRTHINTVVKRYKGRVKGWDVVNEAINDNGTWRESPFYKIIGKDFVKLAFQFAHEADPDAELYYNDYSMALEKRRNSVVAMVKELQAEGIKIDGIGMQGHLAMDFPSVEEFEKSIVAFSELGVKVMITELDLTVLPSPWSKTGANIADKADYQERMNPYKTGVPAEVNAEWEQKYLDFFQLFVKHKDKISRVTLWGLTDTDSWKNDWPIKGRTDYPLLFDRNYQPKPIVKKIMKAAMNH
ncbi:MAG: endo-1,4-beta-xylanase [Paludibacter sp.]